MHSAARSITAIVALACAVHGCGGEDDSDPQPQTFEFDFQSGVDGWQALFTNYPAGATPDEQAAIDGFFELSSRATKLPAPLDRTNGAVEVTGNNHSAALQMLLKRQITGLAPNTDYSFDITLTIASNVPQHCVGAGSSPGEGVAITAGASTAEPMRTAVNRYFQHTLELSAQGDFANSRDCAEGIFDYELMTLPAFDLPAPPIVRTSADGTVWIVVGTASGFEGLTRAYFDHVTVTMQPATVRTFGG